MGKDKMSKKSKLALAAKKCRPIKSYFATKIPTTPDEAGHPTPNRNFACADDDVVDAITDAGFEASVFSNVVCPRTTMTKERDLPDRWIPRL
jgi:hypothetical protein